MEAQAAAQKLAAQRIANLSQVESTQQPQQHMAPPHQLKAEFLQPPASSASPPLPPPPPLQQAPATSSDDLPTDLSMDADEKTRLRERLEREQLRGEHRGQTAFASATILPAEPRGDDIGEERDREQHEPRTPAFDFRLLMPQVTLKTEQC